MRLPTDAPREYTAGECTALESRAETASLEGLHNQRRQLLITLAPLKAVHGHNGTWDARRKSMVEALKIRHRMSPPEGVKVTDNAVDALAHGDPQYERFLDEADTDKIAYIHQQNAYDELMERIRSREIELLCFNSEAKLQR